jgi:predicted ester cyclase
MSAESKELVRRFYERIVNEDDLAIADEVLAPGYEDHTPIPLEVPGPEGFKRRIEQLRRTFEIRIQLHDMVAEGDLVAFRWTITGKHIGDFAGISATQRDVTITGLNLERILDGKITQHWSEYDREALTRQVTSS